MHRRALSVVALVLAGCSASSAAEEADAPAAAADPPSAARRDTSATADAGAGSSALPQPSTARPPGCKRTECDVAYDRCEARQSDRCSACNATCSASPCASERESCETGTRNATCTDGMDARDVPAAPVMTSRFRPPAPAHQGKCTDDELKQLEDTCLGDTGSEAGCRAFGGAHRGCVECMFSDASSPTWGPLVEKPDGSSWINSEGCIASVADSTVCAWFVYEANVCLTGCNEAPNRDACLAFARANGCKGSVTLAESCAATLGVGSAPAYAPCGVAVGDATIATEMSVIRFFCGPS